MTKPDSMDAPEVQSRENAKDARIVEGTAAFRRMLERCPPEAIKLDEEQAALRVPDPVFPTDLGERLMAGVASHANRKAPTPQDLKDAGWTLAGDRLNDEQEDAATNAGLNEALGNVPAMPPVESPASSKDARTHARDVAKRLQAEGRWPEVEPIRDAMMREAKAAYPDKEARQAWVYSELDRLYPKLPSVNETDTISESPHLSPYAPTKPISESGQPSLPGLTDAGAIQGLSEIPEGWPTLPANASLGSELGWVQANRLRIVEERPGRATSVKLGQALSPAPSWAALGWLETSIRSYAKFVDVAAKAASGGDDDEGAVLRRERKSVDEVRALLQEMKQAEGSCPHCGRPH